MLPNEREYTSSYLTPFEHTDILKHYTVNMTFHGESGSKVEVLNERLYACSYP